MKIIDQSWEWLQLPPSPLEIIEKAGRTCYKSEAKIGPGSAEKFVKAHMKHGTLLEHAIVSVRMITNRGVTHELVRHRTGVVFSQESTRYVRYDGNMEFIRPVWWNEWTIGEQNLWKDSMAGAEWDYRELINAGSRPEQAREVLPNSLKTEIVMTANLRELRLILNLRCSKKSHPQMRALMLSLLDGAHKTIAIIFDDLYDKYIKEVS